MAREAVLIVQKSQPINGTVSNTVGIEKGTLLKLADPFTFSANNGTNDIVGGIAYNEKIANDGVTKLAILRGPGDIVKVHCSGAVAVGDPLGLVAQGNYVRSLLNVDALSGSVVIGTALETGADEDTILMELNIQPGAGSRV